MYKQLGRDISTGTSFGKEITVVQSFEIITALSMIPLDVLLSLSES
jgi:hypothetical protein